MLDVFNHFVPRRYLDRLEAMHGEVIGQFAKPVDKDDLLWRMSRSFRAIEAAWRAQNEREFENFTRSMQAEFESKHAEFEGRLSERERVLEE